VKKSLLKKIGQKIGWRIGWISGCVALLGVAIGELHAADPVTNAPPVLVPPAPDPDAPRTFSPSETFTPTAPPTHSQVQDTQANQAPIPDYTPTPEDQPYYRRHSRRRSGGSNTHVDTANSLLNFRFAGLGAYQGSATVYSMVFSWNPQITFTGGQYLALNLGGTELTNALGQNTLALEYQALLGLPFAGPVGIELGVGAQTWFKQGETDPLLSANLFCKIPGFFVDRVFAGYSAYPMPYFYTSEVKVGFGLSF